MTTPTLPGVVHVADFQNPQPFGLYSAATVLERDAPARLVIGGVEWVPRNCGPSGIWVEPFCPDPDEATKNGERPSDGHFPSVTIWATDHCSLYATDTSESVARAQQLLRLHEPLWAERYLTDLLTARATPLPSQTSLTAAVGALEQALGENGFAGVLHARRGFAAAAAEHRLVEHQGAMLTTALGNRWAFGGSYSELGNTIYATGPVTLWRDPISTREAIEHTTNARQVVAERVLVAGWECPDTVYSVAVAG
ncbi:hypothetical protein NDR87_26460 [Nocardia sp. CDC159]|uniref:Uncharacterized protein n=1 Tax=Nocardia pulmonis TaxID=2951408 RepID=A0A9X2EAV6_9NOCA|nr:MULTISPECIES: hypothetical protein [Nocardia]MCM6774991.1 hypothetical protein [Nocardia pulmonis]MCM6789922.1 hypothetical protein [Nocardia sp. CDC159]